jgi:tRNA pseudouridine13 synthase
VLSTASLLRDWPRAGAGTCGSALLRVSNEDFQVREELGFEPDGEGEHALLLVEKNGLNTQDVVLELSRVAGRPQRDIGYSGLKDKHACCQQWFSVGLAGKDEPDWRALESDALTLMRVEKHRKKLRRGVHRRNHFVITLRGLQVDRERLEQGLQLLGQQGVPNYFGEQRFGYQGGNIDSALAWMRGESAPPRRQRRGFYLSAARSALFNIQLATRVEQDRWRAPEPGDRCLLNDTSSHFLHDGSDPDIKARADAGDLHLALPLWGKAGRDEPMNMPEHTELCKFLEQQGLNLDYRAARLLADDFCWQFCDDDALQLRFSLPRGGYATAVLRELVVYDDISINRGGKLGG